MKIIIATKNAGKVKEIKALFGNINIELLSLKDINDNTEIIEDKLTFHENSLLKAKTIYEKYKIPVIADDSGLVVDQLNGDPGVFSARYAGENATDNENTDKLLNKLTTFDKPHNAKFVCSAVYFNGKETLSANGEMHGQIISEKKGNNGFGYDPVFLPTGYNITLAEMNLEDKNIISHRAKAFIELISKINSVI